MLRDSDGAMSMRLLGLLVLSSLCSAMLQPNSTSVKSSEEDAPTRDPNTYRANSAAEDSTDTAESSESLERPWPPVPHSGLPRMFPTHGDNMTDGSMSPSPAMFPTPDAALCDMLLNAPVPPPVDQIPFFCLCSHCKGTTGPKGNRGDRGPPGSPGSPGIRGMTGFKGQRGFTGPQGIKGQKGDMGEKGNPGSAGLTGMKGGRGFKGEKGDGGMEGPPGAQGPQGEAGTCPASCDSVQGPPGPQGTPGAAGARGLPGVQGPMGSKGLKGYKGDPGRPGDHGMDGLKGDQGEQGVCECTDGADGADGKTGEKGTKGVKGEMGTKGAQGTMGLKGNPGTMGPMGLHGPCSPAIQSAFSARINMSFPIQDLPVPFPHVFTNQQGHFNPLMGVYTAPINGTYVFSFHLAVAVRILKVGLFLNYYPLVRTTEATDRSTASHTIVLHLTMGDQVWLQVKNNITNGMFTDDESSSTFSGYLLHPDSCDLPLVRNGGMGPSSQMGAFSWNGPKGGGGGGGRATPTPRETTPTPRGTTPTPPQT